MSDDDITPIPHNIPEGCEGAYDGLFYKVGRFDKLYYWNNSEWIRSTQDAKTVMANIDKKKYRWALY